MFVFVKERLIPEPNLTPVTDVNALPKIVIVPPPLGTMVKLFILDTGTNLSVVSVCIPDSLQVTVTAACFTFKSPVYSTVANATKLFEPLKLKRSHLLT